MHKYILFLDFDGVINSETYASAKNYWDKHNPQIYINSPFHADFDPAGIAHICHMLDNNPEIQVVVSSAWRYGTPVQELKEYFMNTVLGERIIDKTPYLSAVQRGVEIKDWLSKNPTEKFAILDDDDDMDDVRDNFVRTDWRTGVTYLNIHDCLKIMGLTKEQREEAQNKY